MTDTLGPDRVLPLLSGRFGSPYLYAGSCESTQRVLTEEHPEGAVAVCEHQTAGRGRLGRSWEAPPSSSILCSTLLRPPASRQVAELSLVGGLAAAAAVEDALGRGCGIKWPNDVLVDGRKVAGVLAESRGAAVVLGIGLNVNGAPEAPGRTPPTSLRAVDGVRRDRAPLLAGLLGHLERRYDTWSAHGLGPLLRELAERDFLRGRHVSVGGTVGVAAGIARDGTLEIDTAAGTVSVSSGEVRYVP